MNFYHNELDAIALEILQKRQEELKKETINNDTEEQVSEESLIEKTYKYFPKSDEKL